MRGRGSNFPAFQNLHRDQPTFLLFPVACFLQARHIVAFLGLCIQNKQFLPHNARLVDTSLITAIAMRYANDSDAKFIVKAMGDILIILARVLVS